VRKDDLKRAYASAWAGDSGLGLSRRSWIPTRIYVGMVGKEGVYLLDGYCGLPPFVFVQNGETNGSGGINIRMKQGRIKFT